MHCKLNSSLTGLDSLKCLAENLFLRDLLIWHFPLSVTKYAEPVADSFPFLIVVTASNLPWEVTHDQQDLAYFNPMHICGVELPVLLTGWRWKSTSHCFRYHPWIPRHRGELSSWIMNVRKLTFYLADGVSQYLFLKYAIFSAMLSHAVQISTASLYVLYNTTHIIICT